MEVMFWVGLSFLLLYRVLIFMGVAYSSWCDDEDDFEWYDPILVCLELYVFRTVYLSHRNAKDIIRKNAENRKRVIETQTMVSINQSSKPTTDLSEAGSATKMASEPDPVPHQAPKKDEITLHDFQLLAISAEAVFESLPQIMLQSV